jgi:hypothetical protein
VEKLPADGVREVVDKTDFSDRYGRANLVAFIYE